MFSAPAAAELNISFSKQSPEVAKAMFGGSVRNASLVQVSICNDGPESTVVYAGQVFRAANKTGITTVAPVSVPYMVKDAENRSILHIVLKIAEFGAYGVTILAGANTIGLNEEIRAALPLVGTALGQVANRIKKEVPDTGFALRHFLDGEMQIASKACESKMMFWSQRMAPTS